MVKPRVSFQLQVRALNGTGEIMQNTTDGGAVPCAFIGADCLLLAALHAAATKDAVALQSRLDPVIHT